MSPTILSATRSGGSSGSVIAFIFTIAIAYACALIAQRKGRSRLIWFILGGLFSVVTLIAVLLIPRRRTPEEREGRGRDRNRSARDTSMIALRQREGKVEPTTDDRGAHQLESS